MSSAVPSSGKAHGATLRTVGEMHLKLRLCGDYPVHDHAIVEELFFHLSVLGRSAEAPLGGYSGSGEERGGRGREAA